ncbi:uncharacterized protein LOC130894958 [Diorhabda carinulata]|uniref:uncharacterized protein LOC130447843 n=1 Tax=Diorhabda sublineata TaxID=1163346 RepID=UPI0024E120E0|nr:uncharacterized protein LOC130447843 [Diorhabda sublineata]XP_057658010.1 uncharacterized protein LOC130894958 [Diorhabda carinulata]
MHYGKKSPTTGTPSVYSHTTSRSNANLHRSSRSLKSLRVPWYQQPLVQDAIFLDVQRASFVTAIFSLVLSIFTIITACFDLYCYAMAAPGSTHYGYYVISFQFVYVGNRHVRNTLVMFATFSILLSIVVFVTSIMLINALRKEYEKKMLPWLYTFAVFTIFRFLAYLFFSIINDMIFAYNIIICLLWTIFIVLSVYGWVLVYSLYIELSELTRLEDLAHLRMGTMQSLNTSTAPSLAGSRPTTPHSTVSTMPA